MSKNKLILGTVQFGLPYGINNTVGQPSKKGVFSILDKAYEYGIRTLDTAAAYGNSERLIGDFLGKNPVKDYRIITKINTKDSNNFEKSLETSLANLKVKSVDTILFHSFDDFKRNIQNAAKSINKLKGSLFQKIGVSVYDNNEIVELIDNDLIDVIQAPFNLLDNDAQRGELFRALKDKGKTIHSRSSFLQGLFFMNKEKLPSSLKPLIPFLEEIHKLSRQYNENIHTLALNYVLSKNYIDGVLFGIDNISQLEQNIRTINQELPDGLIQAIDKIHLKEKILLNPSKWKI